MTNELNIEELIKIRSDLTLKKESLLDLKNHSDDRMKLELDKLILELDFEIKTINDLFDKINNVEDVEFREVETTD